MGNLPALLANATPLVNRFFAETSKKRQRCAVANLENNFSILAKFTDVYCNCKQELFQNNGKIHIRTSQTQTNFSIRQKIR
jgi:hypothetical protein